MSELVRQLNERLTQVTAERDEERVLREDYQLKLAFTAGDLAFAKTELSELRARVERAKTLLPKIIEDHEYDEGKYGVYDNLVALLAILEGDGA